MRLFQLLATLAALWFAVPAGAAQPTVRPDELAAQARDILRRHCLECHGEGKEVKGDLKILDHVLLLATDRKLVIPKSPSNSELLELIEDGSMPPGTRPKVSEADRNILRSWIDVGAPVFPRDYGDTYVLQKILEDVQSLKQDERLNARYFSFNHFLAEEKTKAELDVQREELTRAINLLSWKPQQVRPTPVERTSTVYRVDARDLGWEARPFTIFEGNKPAGAAKINLFDLALLEYPHGFIYDKSEAYYQLFREFLEPARLVRPIAYVRSDWFVRVATQPPVYFGKPRPGGSSDPGRLTDMPVAKRAWGYPTLADFRPEPRSAREGKLPSPLALGDNRGPEMLKRHDEQVVKQLEPGIAILPLDGLTRSDYESSLAPLQVELAAVDFKTKERKSVFAPNDEMVFVVFNKSNKDLYIELISTSTKGSKLIQVSAEVVKAGQEYRFPPATKKPVRIGMERGKDEFTLFASETPFPPGVLHRAKDWADRVIHPFYEPQRTGKKIDLTFDPANIVKKTIQIETR